MTILNYRRPSCKVIELQVRESVLLSQSELFGINYWNEDEEEEYDF